MLVFLYGTLKPGEPSHNLLLSKGKCTFQGKGTTVEEYPLIVATRYNVPFLLYKPGTGNVGIPILFISRYQVVSVIFVVTILTHLITLHY